MVIAMRYCGLIIQILWQIFTAHRQAASRTRAPFYVFPRLSPVSPVPVHKATTDAEGCAFAISGDMLKMWIHRIHSRNQSEHLAIPRIYRLLFRFLPLMCVRCSGCGGDGSRGHSFLWTYFLLGLSLHLSTYLRRPVLIWGWRLIHRIPRTFRFGVRTDLDGTEQTKVPNGWN